MNDFLKVFDAWEPLSKGKSKGLSKWDKFANIADKLQGKKVEHITFSCCHPSHGGEVAKHTLGSVVGNLHFLMGYSNPGFGVMPYHYQIVDPMLSDEDASLVFKRMGNPANPQFWSLIGEEPFMEGEIKGTTKTKLKKFKGHSARSGYGSYSFIPEEHRVYDSTNKTFYRWSLVKNSLIASKNPELSKLMKESESVKLIPDFASPSIPDNVKHITKSISPIWAVDVYPFIKSVMPPPGTILPLESMDKSTILGVVCPSSILFYDKQGHRVDLEVFDHKYEEFDLSKGGNIHPNILFSFLDKSLNIDVTKYLDFFEENIEQGPEESLPPAKVLEE